jgi:thioredoxin 1
MSVVMNSSNIEEYINGDKLLLVDFYAEWCNPCKVMSPIIDAISVDFDGRVIVGKVDVEKSGDLASRFGIRNIPTLLLFKDGEIVDRSSGSISQIQLDEMINKHL